MKIQIAYGAAGTKYKPQMYHMGPPPHLLKVPAASTKYKPQKAPYGAAALGQPLHLVREPAAGTKYKPQQVPYGAAALGRIITFQ